MNQNEFLNTMRSALAGKVPATIIEDNIRYYEDYIATQMRQGKTESEVLEGLGDPRLLAKTTIEANKHAENGSVYDDSNMTYDGQEEGKQKEPWLLRFFKAPKWFQRILVFTVLFLLLCIIGTIVGYLLPYVLIGLLVVYVIRLFGKR